MASFFCHAFAVTKRFRLERIVRPHGWHATATASTVPAGAEICSQQLTPAGWYSMKVPDSLWTGAAEPYRRFACEAGRPGPRPLGVQALEAVPGDAETGRW